MAEGNGQAGVEAAEKRSNELLFEDKDGCQMVHLHAAQDMIRYVGNNAIDYSVADHTTVVGKRELTLVLDGDSDRRVQGNMFTHVTGHHSLKVKTGLWRFEKTCNCRTGTQFNVLAEGNIQLISKAEIIIQCGKSAIAIGPDEIMIKAPTVLINPEKTVVDPKEFDAFQKVLKDFEGKLDAQEVLDLAVKVLKALLEKVDPLSPAKKNADALATTLGLLTGSPEPSQCAAPAGTPGQSTNPGPTTTGKGEGNVL